MIILILSEPRSGSTNLHLWMRLSLPDFIVLGEPYNVRSKDCKTKIPYDISWIDPEKNYIISEKYYIDNGDITPLLKISDKIICLYREDEISQIESYIMADVTDHWWGSYISSPQIIDKINTRYINKRDYFRRLKKEFEEFRMKNNLKSFTYEELYYGNKIDDLKEYLGIKIDMPFPYGKKYRKDIKIERLI